MFARVCLFIGTLGLFSSVVMASVGSSHYWSAVPFYLALAAFGGWRIYRRRYF